MEMVEIAPSLRIPPAELRFSFARSSGAGGQHVNKVNTRAELRFDVLHSPSLSEEQRQRLRQSLGGRLTQAGVLVIRSDRFRSQGRNRRDCLERLRALLARALAPPPPRRRKRHPSRAAQKRRLEAKRRQAEKKKNRRRPHL